MYITVIMVTLSMKPVSNMSCNQRWVEKSKLYSRVLLLQNNMTRVDVKSSHPNNYFSKKVFYEKYTQITAK